MSSAADAHSHARTDEARVTHLSLAIAIDLERRSLEGSATLDLEVAGGATEVVLDTRRLAIHRVSDGAGAPLAFRKGEEEPVLGAALHVELPRGTTRITIAYAAAPDADALQWLDPSQTAGGVHPFLFTQSHAIQARSWIPLQDSPGIRVTYDATVTVAEPLVAVMSAEQADTVAAAPGTFRFRMREAIPAYLIALAVGDLARRAIGPRTAVHAEPSLLEAAAYELGEMERMLEAAEALLGPYLWGRFDVLVMPPSFPYGGMENPRLTFASPTLLVGDRSLTTVIVHELAHAWAGNLVTNATWNDFWINEGTTVYLELRLNEALWGEPRAALLRSTGWRDLGLEIERMGSSAPDTRLRYDMTGRDPAEGVTPIPYLKGASLFWTLEAKLGRAAIDRWFRGWFARHAFGSVTTDALIADLEAHLLAELPAAARPDLARWVDATGVPEGAAPPPSAILREVDAAAAAVLAGAQVGSIDTSGWSMHALRHFLGTLLTGRPTADVVVALDEALSLGESRNPELVLPWLRLAVAVELASAVGPLERFLATHGRMKYLRPLYQDLLQSAWGAPIARRAYAEARPRLHVVVRAGLDRLFGASP